METCENWKKIPERSRSVLGRFYCIWWGAQTTKLFIYNIWWGAQTTKLFIYNIWWEGQTMKLFIMQFAAFPCYFLPFMPNLNIFSCLSIYVISDTSSSSDYKVLHDVVVWIGYNMEWSYHGLILHTIPKSAQTWLRISGPDFDFGTYRIWHKTAID